MGYKLTLFNMLLINDSFEFSLKNKILEANGNSLWDSKSTATIFKSAARYLQRDPVELKATGGTNWQQYLPPRKQMLTFFPELWSGAELEDWGKKPRFESIEWFAVVLQLYY